MNTIIGRENEKRQLQKYLDSGKPEFVAVYGRRRVGKTFLVTSFFNNKFDFDTTGIIDGNSEIEMQAFYTSLLNYGYQGPRPGNWMEMFDALRHLLEKNVNRKRIVVFIDELPCFDTHKSQFVKALDYFWNSWASRVSNFFLIVCGSATSWIVKNIVDNHGGLHDRITHEMHVRMFNLRETRDFLISKKIHWDDLSVLQAYSVLGGVPYYLDMLDREQSVSGNIDSLFFGENGDLKKEFNRLFKSLFRNPDRYVDIVKCLSQNRSGLTRIEIAQKLKLADNGHLSTMLEDLVNCDFIRKYRTAFQKIKSNSAIYQLTDFYSLFYLTFCKKDSTDAYYWTHTINTPVQNTWYGLAFERVCMAHVSQILYSLHLDRIHTEYYSWRSNASGANAQIDLIIDRSDRIVNICEIKYSLNDYSLTKDQKDKLLARVQKFVEERGVSGGYHITLITTHNLKPNVNSSVIQSVVTLSDLFQE
ncbi:MAG: ATP-binding protein [Bacteroidales bacterium]|nr:ATP-binding protein [Bacteroidales bacterium]